MNKLELKNRIGEYVQTGLKLIGVGNKYAYYYSIWDDGTGRCCGYCREKLNGDYPGLEFISKSKIKLRVKKWITIVN